MVLISTLVARFLAVTAARGTAAPCWSTTVPVSVARASCARPVWRVKNKETQRDNAKRGETCIRGIGTPPKLPKSFDTDRSLLREAGKLQQIDEAEFFIGAGPGWEALFYEYDGRDGMEWTLWGCSPVVFHSAKLG